MPTSITIRTSKGKENITGPSSINEVTVEQYQRILKEWDGEDWIKLFSILFNMDVTGIAESKDPGLEGTLYQTIEFFLFPEIPLDKYEVPKILELQAVWLKDYLDGDPVTKRITIPKNIGNLSIGQKIQARKSCEGVTDLRECMSIVTAIYLQPLVDKAPYDHLRAIELERVILKMGITKIYPIGFFLCRQLQTIGRKPSKLWSQIKSFLLMKNEKP